MDNQPPAKRRGPPRSETHVEQGKPITLPATAGEPQGTLLALWVEECFSVIGRIRSETSADTQVGRLPHGHSWREHLSNRRTQESR